MPPFSSPLRSFLTTQRTIDYGFVAGLGVLGFLIAADLATGVVLTASYASAVIIAALLTAPHRVAYLALLTIAASFASGGWHDDTFGSQDWAVRLALSMVLCTGAVIASEITCRLEYELREMTVIAEVAQEALLPTIPASIDGIKMAARYRSATKAAAIGGDLYEALDTPFGLRVVVGDVRGKGIEAVGTATTVLGAFRQAAFAAPNLDTLATTVDGVVSGVLGDEDFVTAVFLELVRDTATGGVWVRVANCGHHAPLLVSAPGSSTFLDPDEPSPPLGLFAHPATTTYLAPPESRVLVYTDGLVEARNTRGAFYDLRARADMILHGTPSEALDRVLADVTEHAGFLNDDMAMMLLSTPRTPADASAPAPESVPA